jgi:hypothetical protein
MNAAAAVAAAAAAAAGLHRTGLGRQEGRPMEYRDCRRLPFLTKCIMETLRLWPAVGNGTFRELQYDEFVTGPNGTQVGVGHQSARPSCESCSDSCSDCTGTDGSRIERSRR